METQGRQLFGVGDSCTISLRTMFVVRTANICLFGTEWNRLDLLSSDLKHPGIGVGRDLQETYKVRVEGPTDKGVVTPIIDLN